MLDYFSCEILNVWESFFLRIVLRIKDKILNLFDCL